ncbi:hypothetical protein H0H92_015923, partial [Tricholoma furcatifolium]
MPRVYQALTIDSQKKKAGIDRSLRQHIDSTRDRPSTAIISVGISKRRADTDARSDNSLPPADTKRAKKHDPTGLSKDWRKRVVNQRSSTMVPKQNEGPPSSDSFKEQEDPGHLSAVNNSKMSMRVTHQAVGAQTTKDMCL